MAKYKVDITGINTNNLVVLTNKETTELFERLRNGDEAAKEILINGNLKLVLSILKRFNNYSSDGYDTWFDKTLRATNTKWPWQVRTSWPGITSSSGGADMNLTTRPVLVIERKMPWLDKS